MTDWYSVADEDAQTRLLGAWSDAPLDNLEVCGMILNTARKQVIAFAPTMPLTEVAVVDGYLTGGEPIVPEEYVYAQLQQAKNLWNAGRASSEGMVGSEGYTFTPRPLDKTIRSIIRPIDGKPHVL